MGIETMDKNETEILEMKARIKRLEYIIYLTLSTFMERFPIAADTITEISAAAKEAAIKDSQKDFFEEIYEDLSNRGESFSKSGN